MGKKAAAPPASNRDDRQSSESGADNDDHDHDNDHDHDHDLDHEDHNGGDEATPVKRKRLTQACDPCRKKKIKCGMSFLRFNQLRRQPFSLSFAALSLEVAFRSWLVIGNAQKWITAAVVYTQLKAINLLRWDTLTRDRLAG